MFEKIDEKHIKINGCLIDCVDLKHWLETETWIHHTPHHHVYTVIGCVISLHYDTIGKNTKDILFWDLALLTAYGYPVNDKVFSVVPEHGMSAKGYVRSKKKNIRGFYPVYSKVPAFQDWDDETEFTQLTERIVSNE